MDEPAPGEDVGVTTLSMEDEADALSLVVDLEALPSFNESLSAFLDSDSESMSGSLAGGLGNSLSRTSLGRRGERVEGDGKPDTVLGRLEDGDGDTDTVLWG